MRETMENTDMQRSMKASAETQAQTEAEMTPDMEVPPESAVETDALDVQPDAEFEGTPETDARTETDAAKARTDTKTGQRVSVFVREPVIDDKSVALYTLWFGLDYGSILTAYALYQVVADMGYHPFLLEKSPSLWTEHYAETDNIAGKFIFSHCRVLEAFHNEESRAALDHIQTHLIGSDVLWNPDIVGYENLPYFFLDALEGDAKIRVSYASSCGKMSFPTEKVSLRNDIAILLHKFQGVSVRDFRDTLSLSGQFYLEPEITLDPIFLCPREAFLFCAENAVASKVEREKRFLFTYFKNGDERKRDFILRGNNILLERYRAPLRNFIDINRFQESKDALGLETAFHIRVEDWLFYLTHSDFVMTDDYYGMCMAILFEKDFAILLKRNDPDAERYVMLLEQLGLTERLVYEEDDFRRKEYLFRKPVRYHLVTPKLNALRENSMQWLKEALANAQQSSKG